ncbi:MAG: hypothetical protein R6V27_13605 [Balneolaceae bacterium]
MPRRLNPSHCEIVRLGASGLHARYNPALRAGNTTALVRGYVYDAPAGAFCFAQAQNRVEMSVINPSG